MGFLLPEDYADQVQDRILDQITGADQTLLPSAERKAEAEAVSYLAMRYDVATDLAAVDDQRNAQLVMILVDITLYHLHSRINPGQVPQLRIDRYNEAKRWLEWVATGKLKPDLTELQDEQGNVVSTYTYGSNTKRESHY